MEVRDFTTYMRQFIEHLQNYFPPKDAWTPADDALYKPDDLFRIPLKEAHEMQLKSIKHTFTYQYINNKVYQNFCKERNFSPTEIQTIDDVEKIPLIHDGFFKDYPAGRDFAIWLGNIFTGTLPGTGPAADGAGPAGPVVPAG